VKLLNIFTAILGFMAFRCLGQLDNFIQNRITPPRTRIKIMLSHCSVTLFLKQWVF